MNYFSLIDEIKQVSLRYSEEFYEGDIYEYLNSGNHKYPCIILTVQNITTDEDVNTISATIFAVDRLTNDSSNKLEVQSLCMSKITQILGTLEERVSSIQSNTLTPFTEKFSDLCGGMYGEFTLEYIGDGVCDEGLQYKEIELTNNGIYDIIGYDRAIVNVVAVGVDDVYTWIENRVKGSEDGVIPAIPLKEPLNGENLVENLSLLDNRRITANQEIEDGTSLLKLVSTTLANITTLDDTNIGWTNAVVSLNGFDNLRYVKLGAKNIMNPNIVNQSSTAFFNQTIESIEAPYLEFIGERIDSQYTYQYACYALAKQINAEEIYFPNLKRIYNATGDGCTNINNIPALGYLPNCKKITLPKLSDIQTCASAWLGKGTGTQCLANAPECLELITAIGGSTNRENASETGYRFIVSPKLRKFVLGGVLAINNDHGLFDTTSTDLIHLELGGAECSLNMQKWNPTNALRTDTNADDYIDLRENSSFANNLEQFLYNFQTYIADRVADRTGQSALRLTVMPAIYAALEAQEGQTILATLTNKNWTVVQA